MKQNMSLLDHCLPHPFVSVIVAVCWLMLNHSAELFDVVVAIILGLIIPKLIQPFIVNTPNIHWRSACPYNFRITAKLPPNSLQFAAFDPRDVSGLIYW